jgi:hypothetical protein
MRTNSLGRLPRLLHDQIRPDVDARVSEPRRGWISSRSSSHKSENAKPFGSLIVIAA